MRVNYMFWILLVGILHSSCTDYVAQVEDKIEEQEQNSTVDQSSSSGGAYSSSSSVVKSSDSVSRSSESSSGINSFEGILTDSRDGQIYKTVKIGDQIWMAENLNYETADSYCYKNSTSNCSKYGRLYIWAAAKSVCPADWHLPSETEWETLFNSVGGQLTAGKVLKSKSDWAGNGDGSDSFSFSSLPAGYRNSDGYYRNEGNLTYFWSSKEYDSDSAYVVYLYYGYDFASLNYRNKLFWYSVRCLKDDKSEQTQKASSSAKASSSSVAKSSSSVKSSSSSRVVGTCAPDNASVNDGNQVSWKFTRNDNLSAAELLGAAYYWTFDGGTPDSVYVKGLEGLSQKVTYTISGDYGASLVIGVAGDTYHVTCTPVHVPKQTVESSSSVKFSSSSVAKSSSSNKNIQDGSEYDADNNKVKDLRDNQVYRTVTIDKQVWMAENLNYKADNSFCYDDDESKCTKYGRLYTWAAAMDSAARGTQTSSYCEHASDFCSSTDFIRGVCPSGWHLPSLKEWQTLFTAVGGLSIAGRTLKSNLGWSDDCNGTDDFSFSALPAGEWYSYNGNYNFEGSIAFFWSSAEYSDAYGYSIQLSCHDDEVILERYSHYYAFSVRCVKD